MCNGKMAFKLPPTYIVWQLMAQFCIMKADFFLIVLACSCILDINSDYKEFKIYDGSVHTKSCNIF